MELQENALTVLAQQTGIDATSVGTTEIYSVPTGKSFVPFGVVIRCTSFTSGGKSVQAIVSFGGNSATYDDFLNTITYTVTAADQAQFDRPADGTEVPVYSAGTSFRISVETGSDATTETWAVDLLGYLI